MSSPVASISIAPKPPVKASSTTCSISERKLSEAFGSSSIRLSALRRSSTSGISSALTPRRVRTCQSIAAMRSLITLIARRTTGVSAKRRRFCGVGLGSSLPALCTGFRIEGRATVRRSASKPAAFIPPLSPRPVACRQILRNCTPTPTCTVLPGNSLAQKKKARAPKGRASSDFLSSRRSKSRPFDLTKPILLQTPIIPCNARQKKLPPRPIPPKPASNAQFAPCRPSHALHIRCGQHADAVLLHRLHPEAVHLHPFRLRILSADLAQGFHDGGQF